MKMKFICLLFIILTSCSRSTDKKEFGLTMGNLPDTEQRLEWFKEAKFGMFIHWGPYSRLAGEWNGRQVPVGKNAEWIMKELKIPVEEYRELAHEFNPVQFDAKKWVRLAKTSRNEIYCYHRKTPRRICNVQV